MISSRGSKCGSSTPPQKILSSSFSALVLVLGLLSACEQSSDNKAATPKPTATSSKTPLTIKLDDPNVRLFLLDGERGLREYKTKDAIPASMRRTVIVNHAKHPLDKYHFHVVDLSTDAEQYTTTIVDKNRIKELQYAVEIARYWGDHVAVEGEFNSIYLARLAMKDGEPQTKGKRPRRRKHRRVRVKPHHPKSIQIHGTGAQANRRRARYKPVTFYSAKWCGVCRHARAYLVRRKIPHKYVDIDKSKSGRAAFYEQCKRGGRSRCPVPTFVIGGRTMYGWSASRFEQMARL